VGQVERGREETGMVAKWGAEERGEGGEDEVWEEGGG